MDLDCSKIEPVDDFFEDEDLAILRRTLSEFMVTPEGFWRFWSWKELQLDGNFNLPELQALVKAMERIAERRSQGILGTLGDLI